MAETALQKIIRLNKDTVKDPNKIQIGQKIKTDDGEVTVQKGDTLTKIASRPAPSKPQPSTVQDPQQKAAAKKPDAPSAAPSMKAVTPAAPPAQSGKEALLNRSMGAFKAKVAGNIERVGKKLEQDSPTPAGSKADRLPDDRTGSATSGDTMTRQQRSSYEKEMKPYRDIEAKARSVAEAKNDKKDSLSPYDPGINKGKDLADKEMEAVKLPPQKKKYKNGMVVAINPNRIGDEDTATGYDPTTGTPSYTPGGKGGIVSHYDQFFGDYIAEEDQLMTFSEWAHKYRLPATRERKAIKDAQGKIHWRNVPKGAK